MELIPRVPTCFINHVKRLFCNAVFKKQAKLQLIQSNSDFKQNLTKLDLLINRKLLANETIKDNDWIAIRQELINVPSLSENIVDSRITSICAHYGKSDEIINYFKFLQRNSYKLNLFILGNCLQAYYTKYKDKDISAEEEKKIFQIYDKIRKDYPLLDGRTCSHCIDALSLTSRWRETLDLIKMLHLTNNYGVKSVTSIILSAFKNNESKLAWDIINETVTKNPVHFDVYISYISYCQKYFKLDQLQEMIDNMFLFWREHDITPPEFVVDNYADVYKTFGYTATKTAITKKGQCKACNSSLKNLVMSQEEFDLLTKAILQKVIVGEKIYYATTPQELKRYMLFIKTMKPYHVVIDGLNVVYAEKSSQRGSLQTLLKIVNYFYNKGKRVLIMGRAHMHWWSKTEMKALQKCADIFLIKNMSQDDPFILHVTLASGPQTYFVSRDLMRQHRAKLNDVHLEKLFKRWQMSRQYIFTKVQSDKPLKLIQPLPFEINAQKDDEGWHIPYACSSELKLPVLFTAPEFWICIRKNKPVDEGKKMKT